MWQGAIWPPAEAGTLQKTSSCVWPFELHLGTWVPCVQLRIGSRVTDNACVSQHTLCFWPSAAPVKPGQCNGIHLSACATYQPTSLQHLLLALGTVARPMQAQGATAAGRWLAGRLAQSLGITCSSSSAVAASCCSCSLPLGAPSSTNSLHTSASARQAPDGGAAAAVKPASASGSSTSSAVEALRQRLAAGGVGA
jgi:hypothetical protein